MKNNTHVACLQTMLDGDSSLTRDERKEFLSYVHYYLLNLPQQKISDLSESFDNLLQTILAGNLPQIPTQQAHFKLLEMLIYNVPGLTKEDVTKMYNNIESSSPAPAAANTILSLIIRRTLTYLAIFLISEMVLTAMLLYSNRNQDNPIFYTINEIEKAFNRLLLGGVVVSGFVLFGFPGLIAELRYYFVGNITRTEVINRSFTDPFTALEHLAEEGHSFIMSSKAVISWLNLKKSDKSYIDFCERTQGQYASIPEKYNSCPEAIIIESLPEFLNCLKTNGINKQDLSPNKKHHLIPPPEPHHLKNN